MAIDLSEIRYVKRLTFGAPDGDKGFNEREAPDALSFLNRCLNDAPRGSIIAIEKSVQVLTVGEQPVAHETITYHVGFPRRPAWLVEW